MSLVTALPSKVRPSGGDPGWVRDLPGLPAEAPARATGNADADGFTKEEMLAGQRAFRDQVGGVIDRLRGLIGEPDVRDDEALAARAVEWIDAHGLSIAAMYPTHDSADRAPRGQIAWFDAGADLDEEATYDESSRGIVLRPPGAKGESAEGGIRVFFGAPLGALPELLAHEVQHRVTEGEGPVGRPDEAAAGPCADRAADRHFAGYHGEFESYWATGRFPPADGPGGVRAITATTPDGRRVTRSVTLANARQLAIFVHLCGGDTGRTFSKDAALPYAYVPYFAACDPTFAGFVESLVAFGGTNALDSVRIDHLLAAIERGADWRPAADALLPDESAWLLDGCAAAGFWARVDATPDGERTHVALQDALGRCRAGRA